MRTYQSILRLIGCWLYLSLPLLVLAADSVQWNQTKDQMTANVRKMPLEDLLKNIATTTGWDIYMEPDTGYRATAKFKDVPTGDALRSLLGDLNFAIVPQTNSSSRLYVFRTGMAKATQLVAADAGKSNPARLRRVPNELLVQLKPGMNIDDLARKLGAKVTGRIPDLNMYRLQFEDAAAANAALGQLSANNDVASVDYNYYVDRPPVNQAVSGMTASSPQLQLKTPPASGGITIGVVDTQVQSLGPDLDSFVVKHLSVADGSATSNGDAPLHGTTMVNDILKGVSMMTSGGSSIRIVSVDVFGSGAETTTFNMAAGIVLAYNNGAYWMNVSLGSVGDSVMLKNVIQQVTDKGAAIFAAAGNEPTGQPLYPAAYNGVTAVTALGQSGRIASYANVFPEVHVAAPGTSVMNYNGSTWISQGTSVSTAFTTGFAAGTAEMTGQSWPQIKPVIFNKLALPSSR